VSEYYLTQCRLETVESNIHKWQVVYIPTKYAVKGKILCINPLGAATGSYKEVGEQIGKWIVVEVYKDSIIEIQEANLQTQHYKHHREVTDI
jgi:hypothetical protein